MRRQMTEVHQLHSQAGVAFSVRSLYFDGLCRPIFADGIFSAISYLEQSNSRSMSVPEDYFCLWLTAGWSQRLSMQCCIQCHLPYSKERLGVRSSPRNLCSYWIDHTMHQGLKFLGADTYIISPLLFFPYSSSLYTPSAQRTKLPENNFHDHRILNRYLHINISRPSVFFIIAHADLSTPNMSAPNQARHPTKKSRLSILLSKITE